MEPKVGYNFVFSKEKSFVWIQNRLYIDFYTFQCQSTFESQLKSKDVQKAVREV